MANPINNNQASIALTQFIPLTGIVGEGETFGSIRILAGPAVSGADTAEGQILSSAGNEQLFQLYGSAYGGDGTTTFALPNLSGTAEVGFSSGSFVFGGSTGSDQVTLSQAQLSVNLGGSAQPYNDYQPSLTISYLVATQGTFPDHDFGGGVGFLGSIVAYAGDPSQKPVGYALADGSAVAISQNAALFALYGRTYGGDATHFNLPDLRGRTIIGTSAGLALGSVVGQGEVTVSDGNLPVEDGGAAQPIDNREPSLALTYLIATEGASPTSSSSFIAPTDPMIGEVIPWAISGFIPTSNWLPADGRQLNVSDYAQLHCWKLRPDGGISTPGQRDGTAGSPAGAGASSVTRIAGKARRGCLSNIH
jgi:microcystin-dependent protein